MEPFLYYNFNLTLLTNMELEYFVAGTPTYRDGELVREVICECC